MGRPLCTCGLAGIPTHKRTRPHAASCYYGDRDPKVVLASWRSTKCSEGMCHKCLSPKGGRCRCPCHEGPPPKKEESWVLPKEEAVTAPQAPGSSPPGYLTDGGKLLKSHAMRAATCESCQHHKSKHDDGGVGRCSAVDRKPGEVTDTACTCVRFIAPVPAAWRKMPAPKPVPPFVRDTPAPENLTGALKDVASGFKTLGSALLYLGDAIDRLEMFFEGGKPSPPLKLRSHKAKPTAQASELEEEDGE